MVMHATRVFQIKVRSPQNDYVFGSTTPLSAASHVYSFPSEIKIAEFQLYIKQQNEIKTADLCFDNTLYCKRLVCVNDYPLARFLLALSYLSCFIYH